MIRNWLQPLGLMSLFVLAAIGISSAAVSRQPAQAASEFQCSRLTDAKRSTWNADAGRVTLGYRTDLPASTPAVSRPWLGTFERDWEAYMASVLTEIRASGVEITERRVAMPRTARWWVAPWMDYETSGRDYINGLTKERGPDPGDLSPTSLSGPQVWAVGFYNAEGAVALGQVFADPCNPMVPSQDWGFPEGTVSFKFLFTDADDRQVPYLTGAPEIDAAIDPEGSSSARLPVNRRQVRPVRLLQMDIAVRDSASPTGWVFGTYVWHDSKGGGALDGLVPVGLQWGNDEGKLAPTRDGFIQAEESRLNPALAGDVWRGEGQVWAERPFPGFQGRLNGPADNKRSSCLSCHALAQWPRSSLGLLTSTSWNDLEGADPASVRARQQLVDRYMTNVRSGELTLPSEANASPTRDPSRSLDYSLQIESGMSRMCSACARGDLPGATPTVCRVRGVPSYAYVAQDTCPKPANPFLQLFRGRPPAQPLERQ